MKKIKPKNIRKFFNSEFTTEKEIEAFKQSDTYSEYKDIIELFDTVKPVAFNETQVLERLDAERLKAAHTNEKSVTRLYRVRRYISIAASVLLFALLSLLYYEKNNQVAYNTLTGEFQQISLPDNSQVWLNAKSEVTYHKSWETRRAINLMGEAYFEVAKGETFTVATPQGTVKVLGTKFNVKQRDTFYEVYCFEGTVSVTYHGKETILKANSFFSSKEFNKNAQKGTTKKEKPYWIEKASVFENASVDEVVSDLRIQYDFEFIVDTRIDKDLKYTGKYHYDDALETVLNVFCQSLNLEYHKKGSRIYLNKK